ncbi:chemotaxis protein [Noviherbaspirillum denitrificans]|uniref:Chemotaxis protein n=2 Tax=Noviherbaspirillum denitrificans TaxID=1968433 RepID=A0A254TJZ3_9BURK|nr:chemotaxis protein [Noviherbaspirillum denitrificans]
MLLLAVANFVTTRSSTMQAIDTQLKQISEGRSSAIADWVKAERAVVASMTDNAGAGDMLPFLKAAEIAGSFELAYTGYADKRIVFSKPQPDLPKDYDPTGRPWYKQAIEKNASILTPPYEDASSHKLVVSFAQPAKGATAVVAADVLLDSVVNIVLSIKPTPNSYAFLADSNGLVIAHPDKNRLLKPVSDMDSSLSGKSLQEASGSMHASEVTLNGQHAMLHVSRVAGTDWMLAVVLDKAEGTEALSGILKSSLITAVAAAIIAAIILSLFISRIMGRMTAVRDALQDIASGDRDLTRRLDTSGNDELSQIATAFNQFVDQIARVLVDIRSSSDSVKLAAGEIATGNLDLSSRTEQQAGSLQETASAMEELTSIVKQNAENARLANKLAEDASQVAVEGGSVVSKVVTTMDAISASSQKISDIIGVIDGIAFQTNILALNAAVEAARAGEQGRGFAVVASEVRTLAQRSANAAKEIKELISDSVGKVEVGSALVNEAGQTMEGVVNSVKRVTDIMSEILAATQEQSAGIESVHDSIGQMDSVTQQNAALVEEAAAAAGSLQEQATSLADIVAAFKLGNVQPNLQPAARTAVSQPRPAGQVAVRARPASKAVVPRTVGAKPVATANGDWEEF